MSSLAFSATNVRRARGAWIAAWLAVFLNVLAPVIAYATAAARQGPANSALSSTDRPDPHAHHHHHEGPASATAPAPLAAPAPLTAPPAPIAPHCQYCLDFAAAAPLALVVAVIVAGLRPEHDPPARPLALRPPSALVRIAWPRGPPAFSA